MTWKTRLLPETTLGTVSPTTNKEHATQWEEGESQHIARGELQHLRLG